MRTQISQATRPHRPSPPTSIQPAHTRTRDHTSAHKTRIHTLHQYQHVQNHVIHPLSLYSAVSHLKFCAPFDTGGIANAEGAFGPPNPFEPYESP